MSSAALASARELAETARRDPSAGNLQAVRAAIAAMAGSWRLDGPGYNPYRDKGGKFAPGAHAKKPGSHAERVAAKVETTRARVTRATSKIRQTMEARRKAGLETKSTLKSAREAVALARAKPTAKNIKAAQVATNKATRAATRLEKHTVALAKHTEQHALASKAHESAKAKAKETRQATPKAKPEPKAKPARDVTDAELDSHRANFDKAISADERKALVSYASGRDYKDVHHDGGVYIPLNQQLRGIKQFSPEQTASLREMTEHMDAGLAKSKLTEAAVTYRVASGSLFEKLQAGDHFVDPGFVSTSTDRKFVTDYADSYSRGAPTLMQITSPIGTKLGAIGGHHQQEKEMLLGRNSALRLDKRETQVINGKNMEVLHMTVVGQH